MDHEAPNSDMMQLRRAKSMRYFDNNHNDQYNELKRQRDEKEQQYMAELYRIYTDIETKVLDKDKLQVEKAESLVLYTRNQFLRELQNIMDHDESLTLKYQLIDVFKLFHNNTSFLMKENQYVSKYLHQMLINNFVAEEPTPNRSNSMIRESIRPQIELRPRKTMTHRQTPSGFFSNFSFL